MSKNREDRITGYFNAGKSKLYYEAIGTGYPLVLIHDGLADSRVWNEQVSFFADQFQVICYDRRGYGRSERPWEDYSNVQDLYSLLNILKLEKTSLIGVSAGGMVAIDFALEHPGMVDALILVGTAVNGFEVSEHMKQRGQAASRPLMEDDDVDQTIENWMNDPYFVSKSNTIACQQFREFLSTSPHNLYDPHWHSFEESGEPAINRIPEIDVPTLLVIGEADIPDNHAMSGALQVGIKNSKRIVLPNAGHLANLEQPQVFNQLVSDFLESVLYN